MALLSLGRVKSAAMQTINGGTLPIAIDFGTSALKVLQMTSDDTPALVAAAALDTPDSIVLDDAKRFQFQCQALPRLIKAGGFRGKRALCAIPAGHMFVKHMQFPKSEGAALEDLVQAGVPQALGVAPEALVLRHVSVDGARTPGSGGGSGGGVKQEVICLAAARELVDRMMAAVRGARLELVGIHPECMATSRAFDHLSRRAGDEHLSTLLLDLGARTSKVWILHGKQLVFAKVVRLGGLDLDVHVSNVLDLSLSKARGRRLETSALIAPARTIGDPQIDASVVQAHAAAAAALRAAGGSNSSDERSTATADDRRSGKLAVGLTPSVQSQQEAPAAPAEFDLNMLLETVTDEVAMCLRYHEAMFPGRRVDRAAFFGGEARHRGMCQLIARRVKTSVHVADPVARIARTGKEPCLGVDFTTPQPGWIVPFGLSLCPTDI